MEELSRHEQAIKKFVEDDEDHVWFHKRWRKPPAKFSLRGFLQFLQMGDEDAVAITFIPDAWAIDFISNTVWMLEVVDTHRLDEEKLALINILFWGLDAYGFRLGMVVHDVELDMNREVPFHQMSLWALQGGRGEPWKATDELEPTKPLAQ